MKRGAALTLFSVVSGLAFLPALRSQETTPAVPASNSGAAEAKPTGAAKDQPTAVPVPPPSDDYSAEYTIRSDVRRVLLDVSVKNSHGVSVGGLTQENFKVLEDGKSQPIKEFANADIPVTVGILVDESGSMRSKRPEVITAALGFITSSNPQDEMFVINFNEKVYHGLPDTMLFSDNISQLRSALWSSTPEGRTALYDAITSGLRQLAMGRRDKKTLVVISDGGDNVSTSRLNDVTKLAEETLATIYTIGIFDGDDPDRNPDVLKHLARITGGDTFFPDKIEGIVPACRQIAKDIRSRYTIGYVPANAAKDGLRHIKVVVSAPDQGKLMARTRSEYLYRTTPEVQEASVEKRGVADRKKGSPK